MKGENDKNLGIKKVQVFPIVIGALGSVKKKIGKVGSQKRNFDKFNVCAEDYSVRNSKSNEKSTKYSKEEDGKVVLCY